MTNYTLILRLHAPLMSFGSESSVFNTRRTSSHPTRSMIIGLLANALGMQRNDPLDMFQQLTISVRADKPGKKTSDYQIAIHPTDKNKAYVSDREYLQDALFHIALESDNRQFLEQLEYALNHPARPLFIGRKSCPPTYPMTLGIQEKSGLDVLFTLKTTASSPYMHLWSETPISSQYQIRTDVPITYHADHRKYKSRTEYHTTIKLPDSALPDSARKNDELVTMQNILSKMQNTDFVSAYR